MDSNRVLCNLTICFTRLKSLKIPSEIILIQKSIISFVLFIVFYFGRDKYSILKISKEASKDSGHQESFERSYHLLWVCDMVHNIWSISYGPYGKNYLICIIWYNLYKMSNIFEKYICDIVSMLTFSVKDSMSKLEYSELHILKISLRVA